MRIWIDATQLDSCKLRLFNMTLVEVQLRGLADAEKQLRGLESAESKLGGMVEAERHLRRVAEAKIRPSEIWIEMPPDAPEKRWLPKKLLRRLPIRFMREPGSSRERLQRALIDADGEAVLAFQGNTLVDQRLVEHLAWWSGGEAVFIGDNDDPGAALRLESPLPERVQGEDVLEIARSAVENGAIKRLQEEDFDGYIKKLRRLLSPYLFRIRDSAAAARAERFLFESNYKGSTDFMTKWVYPPLVWRIVKPLAARRVNPNSVTAIGIVACFASVPFCAAGLWVPGLLLAYVMSVLDSVDGKLARLTFRSSPQGDVLDHGLDIIHPPFWYWAWGWGLSGGDPFAPVFLASLVMSVFYILDRVMEMLFKSCTSQSIHGYTEVDVRMRTIISRRNVNLPVFTVALVLGVPVPAFFAIVAWQAISLVFHLTRVVRFWDDQENVTMSKTLGNIRP
ncbi:MAG: CDP-alcohol phosphatidyltransferase family protein [Proteobacteria bacterium]|nr:CDP-alcohol phosphatidyltransferase family protein [Pseudomonadota bacterium]